MAAEHLFIGGLASSVTPEDIKGIVEPHGSILRLVHKGSYAFVYFSDPASAESAALALNGQEVHGKVIGARVQVGSSPARGGQSSAAMSPPPSPANIALPPEDPMRRGAVPSVFVGGLGTEVREEDLRALFEVYGDIQEVIVKPKGFAFINYVDPGSAHAAAQALNGHVEKGMKLTVRVQTEENRLQTTKIVQSAPLPVAQPMPTVSFSMPPSPTPAHEIFIGGFGQGAETASIEQAIQQLCASYGPMEKLTVKPGYAFVRFSVPGVAERMAMDFPDGAMWNGKKLTVKCQPARDPVPGSVTPREGSVVMGGRVAGGGHDTVYPIFMGGFGDAPADVIENAVGQIAAAYGAIDHIHVKRGYAFLYFANPTAARNMAADYAQGAMWGDRPLTVKLQTPENHAQTTKHHTTPEAPPLGHVAVPPTPPPPLPEQIPDRPQFQPTFPSLFVGGLASSITERDLAMMFGVFGSVARIVLKKGYAFLDYADESSQALAIQHINGLVVDGKEMAVRVQSDENRKKKTPPPISTGSARFTPY